MRQNGDLKRVNVDYKTCRERQRAAGEKAVSYSTFLAKFTATMVREVAARAG